MAERNCGASEKSNRSLKEYVPPQVSSQPITRVINSTRSPGGDDYIYPGARD